MGGKFPPPGRHPPSRWDLEGPSPSPVPLYIVGVLGLPETRVSPSPGAALPLSLLVSRSAWRSPAGVPRSSTTTTPSCCCWTESSPTSPSLLAGSRHGRCHRAACVLNAEAPLFGAKIGIGRDLNRLVYDSTDRVLATLPHRDLQGYEDALPSLSLLDYSIG